MIVFKYSKTDGAEFISHLDTLRHIQKTLKRANIKVAYSQGFTKRPNINMSSPIGIGQVTFCEYCNVETDMDAEKFKELFNEYAPKNIRCEKAFTVSKKCNVAGIIDGARYRISGINRFNVSEVLNAESFMIIDKKGNEKDVKNKIKSLEFIGNDLLAKLTAGNETLRADIFAETLKNKYGGEHIGIIKEEAFIGWENADEIIEKEYK